MNDEVVPEPKKSRGRGRPTKHGKAMSNNERQKKRQALTNGVFNAVVDISSTIKSGLGYSERFDRDNFTFDYAIESDINVNNIISLLPPDLQEEFKSRVRTNLAKKYFLRDLSVYKNLIKENKPLHEFGERFQRIYIWEIVHGAMHTLHKYDNPTKRSLEAIPFLLDFNNAHEQKYVDAYIKYRLIYGNYWNGISRISLEKKDENKEYYQSEKAHITKMANMRKDIIDFEKLNRSKLIKYGNELDNDIFYEQILHDVMMLNDDALKARHKEIKNVVNHKKDVVPEAPVKHEPKKVITAPEKAEETPAPDVAVIQDKTDVVDSSDKVVVPETRPVRPPKFQRRPPRYVTDNKA
ncbi:hypothetical protein Gbth_119_003 [Gluconobacter thailandicus F149-1 = NBRC 100600]|nr:hypothetical protein [Gluconobacter thailandicus]GAN94862.1 hypothetical protein Gbth_119_003 [Gluconobacter thailandicus F149-1 = NBRC 100600]GBR60093.1 hypothetical protein AA100600_1715 [Gluconobacter thailandicus F149-1 = NBRC 100600]GEL88743.1 hypothetical protein GTH01_31010 [Gluconobacter thailandicus F149-1 = NBRC 100600]